MPREHFLCRCKGKNEEYLMKVVLYLCFVLLAVILGGCHAALGVG